MTTRVERGRTEPANLPLVRLVLTRNERRRLIRYVDRLIDIAARGQTGFAEWHAEEIVSLINKDRTV